MLEPLIFHDDDIKRVRFIVSLDQAVKVDEGKYTCYGLPVYVYDDPILGETGNVMLLVSGLGQRTILAHIIDMYATEGYRNTLLYRDVIVRCDGGHYEIQWYGNMTKLLNVEELMPSIDEQLRVAKERIQAVIDMNREQR